MLVAAAGVSEEFARFLQGHIGVDAQYALSVLRLIGINVVLSGDNAVVIALACRTLRGGQRLLGIILGAGAAVVLRIAFTLGVEQLLDLPWLRLVGGVTLLWVAVKLLLGDAKEGDIRSGANIWEALKIVAIADVIMSLDNVLAIAGAAGNDMQLIIIGLGISIPLVVFGSTVFMWLLHHLPILVWAGAALLGWVAGELIATEAVLRPHGAALAASLGVPEKLLVMGVEGLCAGLVVLVGWMILKARPRPAARRVAE
jgi:YjbE family integral membrane protein